MRRSLCFGLTLRFVAMVFGTLPSMADATILVQETFTHPGGNFVSQIPNPGPGTAWFAHSGAGNKVMQVVDGAVTLEQSAGSGEDVSSDWGSAVGAGDTIYAGFDLTATGSLSANSTYFVHFKSSGNSFNSRVWVTASQSSGDFTIALSGDSSITDSDGEAFWGSDLTYGTKYRVVHSYDFDSGGKSLWIDPLNQMSARITATDSMVSDAMVQYAFRQSTGNTFQKIDNLTVATTFTEAHTGVPEPASLMLWMLGWACCGFCTRRCGIVVMNAC